MKKRVLSCVLALGIVLCQFCALNFWSAAAGGTFQVTVNAAEGGKVSTGGTSWSSSVSVWVANGETLGNRVQYKADEGYKLNHVIAPTAIKKVVASDINTAVIDDAGNLYTAGDHSLGQLGRKLNKYQTQDSVLTKVSTSAKITDVALGLEHIVILDENGEVWTAGSNQYGALGTTENRGSSYLGVDTFKKVTVGSGSVKIKAVAAGKYHTILIDENGGVWMAGQNSDGQFGSEPLASINSEFKKVDGLNSVKIIGAAGGDIHTILLDENGSVWTAGSNVYEQLGRETADNKSSTFEKVTSGISGVKITAIAAGSSHSVLLDESGNVWTAGNNLYKSLGRETSSTTDGVFQKADLQGATAGFIAAGGGSTIVIDTNGNARTCGLNGHGQLGRSTEDSSNSRLLAVTNGIGSTKMAAAAAGAYHSVLLDDNGGIWTCGLNQCGQLCRDEGLRKSVTFAAVTNGLVQNITFDQMQNTAIAANRAFTITAAKREKVQLQYELNGGEWVSGFTSKDFYYKDEGLVLPTASNIQKPGYTFVGWETTSLTEEPIKCSAKWLANTYLVTLNPNGGKVTPETVTVTYGKELDPMPIPTMEGYVFDGWYDQPEGGRCYSNGKGQSATPYDKTENCTLYAQWRVVGCTLTFDPNGGTLTGSATSDERVNGRPGRPADPVREGHEFKGWYKDAACTQKWNFGDLILGDMTLYAGWEVCSYTLTIKPENGEQDITMEVNFGTPITAPSLKKPGYTFAGWNPEFPEKMPARNLTITAQWSLCSHSGSTAKPTCTEPAICTVCGGTIAKLGHDFSVPQHNEDEHWQKCSRCSEIANKNAHDWDNGTTTTPATCTTAGEKVFACTKCSATKKETIQANGHDIVLHRGQAPTCAKPGWEDYETCRNCGYTTYKELPATGNHPYEWQSENGQYWQKCKVCSSETAKKNIPVLTITGAGKVCRTQNYTFGFTLPEGCKLVAAGYEFKNVGSELEALLKNGEYTAELGAAGYPAEENAFKVTVTAETEDGFVFKTEKAVAVLENHEGGTANCHTKAVCEVCGESYGEFNAANHTNLKHIPAKAATQEAEGNTEYWYCGDCGKYYSDAAATKEITAAATVTEKLPAAQKSPKTGDYSNPLPCLALLFVSGGVLAGARKRKGSINK